MNANLIKVDAQKFVYCLNRLFYLNKFRSNIIMNKNIFALATISFLMSISSISYAAQKLCCCFPWVMA